MGRHSDWHGLTRSRSLAVPPGRDGALNRTLPGPVSSLRRIDVTLTRAPGRRGRRGPTYWDTYGTPLFEMIFLHSCLLSFRTNERPNALARKWICDVVYYLGRGFMDTRTSHVRCKSSSIRLIGSSLPISRSSVPDPVRRPGPISRS